MVASLDRRCRLVEEGSRPGSCLVYRNGLKDLACKTTLKWEKETPYRLIHSYAHKAPECYISIYQSGCNWSCKKCHSWRFTRYASGYWASPKDIASIATEYVRLNRESLYREPRNHATSWHAHELCHSCGSCILLGKRSKHCPGRLGLDQLTILDDGTWGPARNIISFTGGDLACQPEFYAKATEEIKTLDEDLWVLFETNGYGLTSKNLDTLGDSGMDAFWLDIKAYDDEVHRRLTGASNKWILELPAEILERKFVLEVSSLYIPGWVETDQITKVAELLAQVDREIPYAIVAFFPEHEMTNVPSPNLQQMVEAFQASREAGLKNVRLGNVTIFTRTDLEYEMLVKLGAI